MGGSDAGPSMLHWFVCDAELTQVMTNHLRLHGKGWVAHYYNDEVMKFPNNMNNFHVQYGRNTSEMNEHSDLFNIHILILYSILLLSFNIDFL